MAGSNTTRIRGRQQRAGGTDGAHLDGVNEQAVPTQGAGTLRERGGLRSCAGIQRLLAYFNERRKLIR